MTATSSKNDVVGRPSIPNALTPSAPARPMTEGRTALGTARSTIPPRSMKPASATTTVSWPERPKASARRIRPSQPMPGRARCVCRGLTDSTVLRSRSSNHRLELRQQLPDDVHFLLVGAQVAGAKCGLRRLVMLVGLGDELLRGAAERHAGQRSWHSGRRRSCGWTRRGRGPRRTRASRPRTALASVDQVQGVLKRRRPDYLGWGAHDHPLEYRDASLGRYDVYGLDVEQRALQRDHEQVAQDHLAAALSPQ